LYTVNEKGGLTGLETSQRWQYTLMKRLFTHLKGIYHLLRC